MNDTPNLKRKHTFVWTLIFGVIAILFAAGVFMYGNRIVDNVLASRFSPTTQIAGVHDNLKLTREGANLLYASEPTIEKGQAFNNACSSGERTQAILGCYNMRKIYLFDITNPQLAGAEEVTAAHEMLHAAYDRLNILERPAVDKLIVDEYKKIKDDPSLSALIGYYAKTEPGAVNNELHSIIGTTIANISPELENYYARYFTNRQTVVSMNTAYTAVFKQVDIRSKQISGQVSTLKPQIDIGLNQYNAALQQLNADISTFNARVKAGVYISTSAFSAARQSLLNRIDELNARRGSINNDIASYNALVAEQNKLSVEVEQLNSSINAAPAAGGV